MRGFTGRGLAVAATLAAALVLQFGAIGTRGAEAQTTGLTVATGAGEPGYAVNLFGTSKVTVAVGSTLTFKNGWLEPHTVTFSGSKPVPPPSDPTAPVPTNPGKTVAFDGVTYLNSGFLLKDQTFALSFPNKGTYPFVCIIHPGMNGSVDVVDAGSATISTQAQLDASATKTFADATAALKAASAAAAAKGVTKTANADGTSTWTVTVGGLVGPSDLQQFYTPGLNVQAGDTVHWVSAVPTPHTATFLSGTPLPIPPTPENQKVLLPTPAPAAGFDGTGYVNSGIIGVGWPGTQFSVKFTKAGTYPYICVLHVDQGMGGTVTVSQAGQVIPAKTGTGGLVEATTASTAMQAALVLALVGIVAVARRATKARA